MKRTRKMRTENEAEWQFDSVELIIEWHKQSFFQKLDLIRSNVSKLQMMQFKKVAGLEYLMLSNLLNLTDRTLYIMQDAHLFDHTKSDILASIIDIYGHGYKKFDNAEIFNKWMKLSCPELQYRTPLDYCVTNGGRDVVREEISRISELHGGSLQFSKIFAVGFIQS